MKLKILASFIATALLTVLVIPFHLAAQEQEDKKEQKTKHHHYKLIEMGTFGGPSSYFTFISRPLNKHGVAAGMADTPAAVNPPLCLVDCFLTHAFLGKHGVITDLGALPGIGGSFVNDINGKGVVTGMSLNGRTTPVLGGLPLFDAVVWKDGELTDLGTFGGSASYAGAINDHDQVVGFALNSTPDSFDLGSSCQNFPMPTQMHAFIWHEGFLRDLGTLGGTDSCALFINERGQVAGNSFTNTVVNPGTGLPTLHPFLWDGDEMKDLGTLGGTLAFANGINNRGQIAGASTLAGDSAYHAFLWDKEKLTDFGTLGGSFVEVVGLNETGEMVGQAQLPNSQTLHAFLAKNGGMTDLGTLDGNPCGLAISINTHSQIVGFSHDCSLNNAHAFLWEDGHMIDLNTLVPSYSALTLTEATFINDSGEITAERVLSNGDQRAVLLIPCDDHHPGIEGCDYDEVEVTAEAPVRSAENAPASAAASTAKLSVAEMLKRSRFSMASRYRRFGAIPLR
jgi:probable HAF family extracellular repeat protein